ncbi:pheromone A receptor-domain-containing protein [Hypoxylon sp. FL1150]|nr:pheromone A receptor-domain-containing protein [Hypoxylon sp. FL1150]
MPAIINLALASAANNATQDRIFLDQRFLPNPSLKANLAFRVILAVLSTVFCWVPFRLLSRNGELAPVFLIAVVTTINLFTVLNAAIWSGDDWDAWWDGAGLCDVEVYLQQALYTAYAASVFAIVHRLAEQLRLDRATPLGSDERAQVFWTQFGLVVPTPLLQVLFTFFDISQRYKIGTLVGCMPVYDVSWPRVVFYELPTPLYVFAALPYAVLAWKRYRAIVRSTQDILSTNSAASARARQVRCRLYNMSFSIVAVYFPVSVYYMSLNIYGVMQANFKTYDFDRIHYGNNPYPWDAILFVPSWLIPSSVINQPWIPIATNIAIVLFFGTTRDGLDMYRRYAVALGLARLFPCLRQSSNETPVPQDEPINHADPQSNWIELEDLSPRRDIVRPVEPKPRHARPYPLLSSPVDESLVPAPLNLPNRPRTPGRPLPPTPLRLDGTIRVPINPQQNSPLQSSRVIECLIPERRSSLYYHQQYDPYLQPTLRLPVPGGNNNLPRIREVSGLRGVSGGRDIVSPWVTGRQARAYPRDNNDDDNDEAASPILPAPSSTREWMHHRPAESSYRNESSPRTIDSTMHKTSRDVVQPRNMIGGWDDAVPAPNVATTHEDVQWPFFYGRSPGAETTPSPSPSPSPSPVQTSSSLPAEAGPSNWKGQEKAKAVPVKDEDSEEEDSFIRHRDDPMDPDPWDSPPSRLAPGLEAISRPEGYKRKRIPRTSNVCFADYLKPKESPKENGEESAKQSSKKGKEPEGGNGSGTI